MKVSKVRVEGLDALLRKMRQQMLIGNRSEQTVSNYLRAVEKMSLYYGKHPQYLEEDQLFDYLCMLKEEKGRSSSTIHLYAYGIKYLYRHILEQEDKIRRIPYPRREQYLPVVLSRQEAKNLFATPFSLKHRIMFMLTYSSGLRLGELCNLKIADIDSERMQILVRQGKGNKDRYTVLSHKLLPGLRKYYCEYKPEGFLFNGRTKGLPISRTTVQRAVKEAAHKCGIKKKVNVHTLRHSFATHLLDDGMDVATIQQLLGHASIKTTMVYLHVCQKETKAPHSPLDTLYKGS